MPEQNALYFSDRKKWRSWLEKNFQNEKEIWLIFPNKSSGRPRIPYNDAVEEALCFGWIDSTIKKYDEESAMQRFTPRKPKSTYSQPNKERLKWLRKERLIHPSIQDTVDEILKDKFEFPKDIIEAIKKDRAAWNNYQNYSLAYKRIRIAYIDSARKRPEEFEKRLANFIKKTRDNKMIGYGGIEKYY
jgi:uncharacterized protein YdeI (YjbR/CyaY-like superfamily)